MDQNKHFAELVGAEIDWIGCTQFSGGVCDWAGEVSDTFCNDCIHATPLDYAADPRLVLREMRKREDWSRFGREELYYMDLVGLVLDTTGKLRDAAIEWLERGK
jgi:hypothetical protein